MQEKLYSLIIISGPSGSGKSSISSSIVSRHKNFILSISATTRKIREHEIDGRDYFFINREKFREYIDQDAFLEYVNVFDNYYGTLKDFVFKNIKSKNIILNIDYIGASKIKEAVTIFNLKSNIKINLLTVFVSVDNMDELHKRLKNRGESDSSIQNRLKRMKEELQEAHNYDYVINNNITLEDAVCNFEQILKSKALI